MRDDEVGGACRSHGEMRNEHKILFGNPKKKKLL
jgi:hypothetical protein